MSQMFAEYVPRTADMRRGLLPAGLGVRAGLPADGDGLARLQSQREGRDYAAEYKRRVRELGAPPSADRLLLVAVLAGEMIAFGRVKYVQGVQFAPGEPTGPVPEGWYLDGVIVDPAWRRRGIGRELTRDRLKWIAERAREAYYFANSRNLASIDLHRQLGFAQLQYDFHFPGAYFTGGVGILFRAGTHCADTTVSP